MFLVLKNLIQIIEINADFLNHQSKIHLNVLQSKDYLVPIMYQVLC